MSISEQSSFAGRNLTLTWQETDNYPDDLKVSQVSAFCINGNGEVLIIHNKHGWGLPGGHPELGETIDESLRREIREEANCSISDARLFGYIEVSDPDNEDIEGKKYLQLRFFCHLDEVSDFENEFETSDRKLIPIKEMPQYISWMISSATGKAQYEAFLKLV